MTTQNAINAPIPFSLANGGTGAALTASNGGILYSNASTAAILGGTATANQLLLSGASGAPAWSTVTHPATTTINQILYSSAANVISGLATANNGVLLTSSGGVPSIGTATVAVGGTGNTTFTAYSVICAGTTATGNFQNVSGVGAAGTVLTSNGASALPTWQGAGGGTGIIKQVQTSNLTTVATTSSTSPVSTGLSVTITPSATSSNVAIFVYAGAAATAGYNTFFYLYRGAGSTLLNPGTTAGSRTSCTVGTGGDTSNNMIPFSICYVDSPNTTSATTYYLYYSVQSGASLSLNATLTDTNSASYPRTAASIIAMEIL